MPGRAVYDADMSALASSRPFRALGVFAAATILAALGGFRVVAVLRDPLGPRPARGFEALRVTGAYQTSAACEPCHKDHVESWKRTFHSTMTRDASASSIAAPFDGRPVDFQGVRSVPRRRGDAFVLDVRGSGAGEIASYEISRVTGSRRMQQFETRITDRYVRLPIAWSIEHHRLVHQRR